MGDLSLHFSRSEFACRCGCGRDRVSLQLVEALEELRRALGNRPLRILSGARCWQHNRRVGGSPASRHLATLADGSARVVDAADVACDALMTRVVYRAAETVPRFARGGIGVYPAAGFVHVDCRPQRARWAQLERGGPLVGIPETWLT